MCQFVVADTSPNGSALTPEDVRAIEAIFLTGLTTGLPVRFVALSPPGRTCKTRSVIISRAGK